MFFNVIFKYCLLENTEVVFPNKDDLASKYPRKLYDSK